VPELIERAATVALLLYLVARLAALIIGVLSPRRDARWQRSSLVTLLACAFAAIALIWRGGVVSPDLLDDHLFGGHNWINLVQNVFTITALWFMSAAIFGITRNGPARLRLHWLAIALITITVPFIFIDKGDGTGGRNFVIHTIGQTPMLIYALIYMAWLTYFGVSMLIGTTRRRSWYYVPLRVGAGLMVAAAVFYAAWAILAYWDIGPQTARTLLYLSFTPLFFTGIIAQVAGSAVFTAALFRVRANARTLTIALSPDQPEPAPGTELAALYEIVINDVNRSVVDSRPASASAHEAARLLSQNAAMQIPDFRRKKTYRP